MSYSVGQIDKLSNLIAKQTGLNTSDHNFALLLMALQNIGIANIAQYTHELQQHAASHPIWQRLLAELTINETYFMRDTAQMQALKQQILPNLIRARYAQHNLYINIWSAGCSSGEEAYSLAILLWQLLPDHDRWHIRITGTDINDASLAVARQALYRDWSFRHTSPEFKEQYFIPKPNTLFELRPEIRKMVTFEHHNLIKNRLAQQDVVLCRNVLIYFRRSEVPIAERSLYHALREGGWLILSPVETLHHMRSHFTAHHFGNSIVFQRIPVASTDASLTIKPASPRVQHVPDYYQLAVEAFHSDQIAEADNLLQKVEAPLETKVRVLQAAVDMACGRISTAQTNLKKLTQQHPFVADAHYLLALLHLEQDHESEARNSIRAGLYCQPQHVLTLMLSGDLYMRHGDYEHAAGAWSQVRTLADMLAEDEFLSPVANVTAGQILTLIRNRLD